MQQNNQKQCCIQQAIANKFNEQNDTIDLIKSFQRVFRTEELCDTAINSLIFIGFVL